jgi:hypothetical protein
MKPVSPMGKLIGNTLNNGKQIAIEANPNTARRDPNMVTHTMQVNMDNLISVIIKLFNHITLFIF